MAGVLFLALAATASAQVVVTVDGDTANATISLTDNAGHVYEADVTIVFDTPQNLTPQALNLTAEIVDPAAVDPRLKNDGITTGLNANCLVPLLGLQCPTVDPDFPVLITVEPIDIPWLFRDGFDAPLRALAGSDGFSFLNTYQIDVHTHDLPYVEGSSYRLFKAPVGGDFHDITTDVLPGSMRARGRGGAFSQFVVVSDPRPGLTAALLKLAELNVRILAATISDGLRLDLLALVAQIDALIVVDVLGAIDLIDQLIALIDADAGTSIPNVWTARRDVVNDAGEMGELAHSLRFSATRALGGSAHP
ncbi:MAG TPA: DUF6689 family protein [Rhodanobacteraceae bacterium]